MATYNLTEGNIPRRLAGLMVPMFLGISSMIVAGMIETIYIGILGADQLAAYSFTFPLIMGLSSVSMGIGTGAASIIARAQGRGDRELVRRLTTHATWLTVLLVALLVFFGERYQGRLFAVMGAEARILGLVGDYMHIWIFGLALFTLPMVANTILRAVGNARVPGYVMTLSSALQVVLSPMLLFGLLGMPKLGFVGSAWASIITGSIRTAAMLYILVGHERLFLWGRGSFSGMLESCRSILYIGVPSMLNSLIGPVSMGTIIWLLSSHGPDVVAGFGITSRFEMLVNMVLMSLSASVGPFVGQNWGARQVDRVYQGLAASYKFSLFWGALSFACLAPFGGDLVRLINPDPELVQAAGRYLMLVPVSYGVLGIGMVSGSLFVALGHPLPTTALALLRMLVIYIPLAMLFDRLWGYVGIFIATTVSNVIMGGVALYWSRRMLAGEVAGYRENLVSARAVT